MTHHQIETDIWAELPEPPPHDLMFMMNNLWKNLDEINDRNQASKRSMTITMEGALSKWTNVMKGWQYRWFVLDDSAGIFSYYTSKDKMTRGVRRGCVRLRGALIGIDDEVGTGLFF